MWKALSEPFRYKRTVDLSQAKQMNGKEKNKIANKGHTLKRIWKLLTVQKGLFYFALLLVVCSSVLALTGPVLLGKIIDDYIVKQTSEGLATILLCLLLVYIGYSLSLWLQNYIMIGIAQRTVVYLRSTLFQHLHKLPMAFFDKRQQGELMSRVTNDIENVSATLNSSVIQIFSSTLIIVGTFCVMMWLSPILTVITFVIVPAMFYGMKWITKRTSLLFKEQQRNLGALNGTIQESLSGQTIIKAFSQEDYVTDKFLQQAQKMKQSGFWSQSYSGMIPKLMNLLNNIGFAFIVAVGGFLALKGIVSIGVIVIFVEFSRQFTRPLNDLANQFNTLLSAIAGADRVFEILDLEKEGHDETDKKQLGDIRGDIEFEHVSFSYNEQQTTVKDISFVVRAGESVALVGPTGAGKTTIVNLLSRFYNLNEGTIKIDGQNIHDYTRESVRKKMAFVLQESFLFRGTILENIRYGNLSASDEEVIESAKFANAHSFIERLPNGYQTVLEDGGSGLSQGQKQLLAIARAMLAKPSILILDEATSSIDTITEMHIQEGLQRLMKGRTSIIIAHRLNTVREADQILVLQQGRLVEKGSHHQLVAAKGLYYDLVMTSLKKQ